MKDKGPKLIRTTPAEAYNYVEFESQSTIDALQEKLLIEHISYTAEHSPYYKALFQKLSIDPSTIKNVRDLKKIPFTTKRDINLHNDEFRAIEKGALSDICLTSATTGDRPTAVYQSSGDIARLAYNEEAAFRMMGIDKNDGIMICAAIDRCFMAGLAYYLGGLNSGSTMIRAGSGSPAQQWELIKSTNPNVLVGVPSLIRKLGQYALQNNEDPKDAGIQKIVCIGETVRSRDMNLLPVPAEVETMWGAELFSTYASSEMATAFCECEERCGGHLRPELVIIEIINEDDNPVPPGEKGEIVVTPLGVEGMPLLRFKTGDISFIVQGDCKCGRNTLRLGPIMGRKNQMLKFKGTTIFPATILSALESLKGVEGAYVEARKNDDHTDRILVYAALSDPRVTIKTVVNHLRAKIRVVPEIVFIDEKELNQKIFPPEKRKKTTFFDYR